MVLVKYQARGSTHAYGCAKFHNDPNLCKLARKAVSGWLAAQTQQTSQSNQHLQVLIEEGQQAQTCLCQYVDWLVTTVNDALPSTTDWIYPSPHPCSQSYLDISEEDIELDYINLVNAVERHTKCSAGYCLRKKQGQDKATCRFKYPKPTQTSTVTV